MTVGAKKPFARLGNNIVPEHYKLTIKIDTDACVFSGSVEANIKVNEPCTTISLYSIDLVVTDVELRHGETKIPAKEVNEKKGDERVEFVMESPVPKGSSVLKYSFSGKLNEQLNGLYLCKSVDEKGNKVNSASTHFEATSCRRAFPCWDEPAMKATFEVTLITKKDLLALSNTSPVEEKDAEEAGWKVTRFERTPKMSTYLVCFVVGRYDFLEARSARSVRVRVYVPVGKKEQGEFALNMAVKSLNFLENYFQVPYPLSKMDLISIPDFLIGAMENWGLITFRETRLLSDPTQSTTHQRKEAALVIAHEISHMWFGNLVTMEWWTSLWLKEGFATFMAMMAVEDFAPEFDVGASRPADILVPALNLDALDSSHPIEVEVHHPSEVDEIFDQISYEKGASVLAMIHNYLGREKFRAGLQLYMERHAYGNTTTEDLWAALSEKSGQPVGEVMNSWVKQMGFPIVSVKSREVGADRVLEFKQKKFYSSVDKVTTKATQPLWKIPLVIGTAASKTTTTALLDAPEKEVKLEDAAKAAWVHVNYGATGVFRVHYDKTMLEALMPAVRDKSLPTTDRFMLHSDLVALVKAGYASAKDLLMLTQNYVNETEYSVWQSVLSLLASLDSLLDDQPKVYEKFRRFGRELLSGIFAKLGWDAKPDDRPADAMLRISVLNMMVTLGDEKVLEEAGRRFNDHVAGTCPVAADSRRAVYVAAAMSAHKNPALWDKLMKLFREADLQEERVRVASALTSVQSKDLLLKVLEFADSDQIRNQDHPFIIGRMASSSLGREVAWAHFCANFEKYRAKHNAGRLFARMAKMIAGGFHTFEQAKAVQAFFEKKPADDGGRILAQTLECIENKAAWLQRSGDEMAAFFNEVA